MSSKNWYLYIIETKDNTLYTGITTDIVRRFKEHSSQNKKCAKYLRGKSPLKLVFKKLIGSKKEASKIECKVKKMTKKDKIEFIFLNKS